MPNLVLTALCAALATPMVRAQEASEAPSRPNLLVLIGDDHAASALGCAGHPFVETPALDRLAAEGVRFTQAFATTAQCSPSRASFLTGLWARQHGIVDDYRPFPEDLPTFLSLLGEAGYETGMIGKWHMGQSGWSRPELDFCATFEGEGQYVDCAFRIGQDRRNLPGFVDDAIAGLALDFLQREHEDPFVLTVAFRAASGPREPKDAFRERFADAELGWPESVDALPPYPNNREYRDLVKVRRAKPYRMRISEDWAFARPRVPFDRTESYLDGRGSRRDYFRLVAGLDENVGQVLRALELFGHADDTIVVYVSDNGMMNGEHSLTGSGAAYEESIRIPWIVRHPGVERRGVTVDELVLNVDLLPTLLDWTGVPIPEDVAGRSLAPLVEGEEVEWRDAFLYEYWRNGTWTAHVPDIVALRTRDWKLVEYPDYPGWRQLFDLNADPSELENLADDEAQLDRLLELRQRLAEIERAIGPRLE